MHAARNVRFEHLAPPVVRSASFCVLTVVLGVLGQTTFYPPAQISLIWPVSGVALVWLLTATTPRVLALDSALLAVSAAVSVLLGIGGLDRAVVGAVLAVVPTLCSIAVLARMRRWRPGAETRTLLTTLPDLFPLGVAVVVGGGVAAVLRAWGLGLLEPSGTTNALLTAVRSVCWTFVLGSIALVTVAHLPQRSPRSWAVDRAVLARSAELATVLAVSVAGIVVVFRDPHPLPVLYPAFLVVVWAALRSPPAVASLASAGIGLLGLGFTLAGDGPFVAVQDPRIGAVLAQGFLVCLTLVSLIMSLSIHDRRDAQTQAEDLAAVAQGRADLLDAVIANIAEGILVLEADSTVLLRNDAVARLGLGPSTAHGGPPPEDQPYRLWETAGAPVDPDQLPSRLVLRGETYVPRDFALKHSGTVTNLVEVNAVKLPPLKDQPPRAVVTFRDVTQERGERTELEAFAGVVAHDLSNPLTIIQGWSEALVEEAGSPATLDHATVESMSTRIMAASTHMHAFITDLLSYTTSRNQPLRVQDVDLSQLCRDVISMRVPDGGGGRIDVQPDMTVRGDPALLRQLMDNLIGNSLKYVEPGTRARVDVTTESTASYVTVTVRDNGIGIPSADRAHVFGNFYRVDSARAAYQGTGLGLAICHRVVARHGGDIWVADPPPEATSGTSIQFTLPRSTAP